MADQHRNTSENRETLHVFKNTIHFHVVEDIQRWVRVSTAPMLKDTWRTAEQKHRGCTAPKCGKNTQKQTKPNKTPTPKPPMQKHYTKDSLLFVLTSHKHMHKNMYACVEDKRLHHYQHSRPTEWKQDAEKKAQSWTLSSIWDDSETSIVLPRFYG